MAGKRFWAHRSDDILRDTVSNRTQAVTAWRLIGTFVLIVVVLGSTCGTLAYWLTQSYSTQDSLELTSDIRAEVLNVTESINSVVGDVLLSLWTDTASGNANFKNDSLQLDSSISRLQTLHSTVVTPQRLESLQSATSSLTQFLTHILDLQQTGQQSEAIKLWEAQGQSLIQQANDSAENLRVLTESSSVQSRDTRLAERSTATTAIIIAVIFAVLLLLFAVWNSATALRSINRARRDAENRARALIEATTEVAQQQRQNAATGTEMRAVVSQLSTTAQQQAAATDMQAREVLTVVSAVGELNEAAHQIAARAQGVADRAMTALEGVDAIVALAQQTDQAAANGQLAVTNTVTGIEAAATAITTMQTRLDELTSRSQRIEEVLRLITGIADQIHLLALNAAIEAAGTPDGVATGERFGVVANEIRQLADRTVNAAAETGTLTRSIQQAVQQALRAATTSTLATSEAVALAHTAGTTIDRLRTLNGNLASSVNHILDDVASTSTLSTEIDNATHLQERAGDNIMQSMESLTRLAQETAQAITQLAGTADHLGHLSERLVGRLSQSVTIADSSAELESVIPESVTVP